MTHFIGYGTLEEWAEAVSIMKCGRESRGGKCLIERSII